MPPHPKHPSGVSASELSRGDGGGLVDSQVAQTSGHNNGHAPTFPERLHNTQTRTTAVRARLCAFKVIRSLPREQETRMQGGGRMGGKGMGRWWTGARVLWVVVVVVVLWVQTAATCCSASLSRGNQQSPQICGPCWISGAFCRH